MTIQRIFVDWHQPLLRTVAAALLAPVRKRLPGDLSSTVVVFPGRRAGRRFLEILAEEADGKVIPPQVITVGSLPEMLYEPQRPFATDLTQRLAWASVLRTLAPKDLEVVLRRPPEDADHKAWLRLGEVMRRQHEELARDRLNFGDVARNAATLEGWKESERWRVLANLQSLYLKRLDKTGLWDQQTARHVAIDQHECQTSQRIVLVGAVDLNQTLRAMLNQAADQVVAYVHAGPEDEARFDNYGCLIPEAWAEQESGVATEQVRVVSDTAAQAQAVVEELAAFHGRYALDDIAVAAPDEQIVPQVRRLLDQWNLPSHWGVDCQLAETAPFRLLQAMSEYTATRRTDAFAAFLRHPDVGKWIRRLGFPEDWLTQWDQYFCEHLPRKTEDLPGLAFNKLCARLRIEVDRLLQEFRGGPRPLSLWQEPVRNLFLEVYGELEAGPGDQDERRVIEACRLILEAFDLHESIPKSLQIDLSASEAIETTLEEIADVILNRPDDGAALQITGWLDVPLDDTSAVIVTSFNEGFVPASVNHDLFLPNRLRTHLGIEDNSRRYARDLYALRALLRTRESVRLIVARKDSQGDPLAPSRLLFASPALEVAQRVLQFYDKPEVVPVARMTPAERRVGTNSQFRIPRPDSTIEIDSLRVTSFRDYLASPYRFYLRHVLELNEVSDDVSELDAAAFGTLVHDALRRFGESSARDSDDERQIADSLLTALELTVRDQYGNDPLAAVHIQIEQARRRLQAFAGWQADWRRQGWKIRAVEAKLTPVEFPLGDGRSIQIRGRIDRIDWNESERRWTIFDYKTGEAGADPEKSHRHQGEWYDLQLPLYRHLAAQIGVAGEVDLGYIVLPRDTDRIVAHVAGWSRLELDQADRVAQEVGRRILDGEFWAELPAPSGAMPEFDGICQTHVFGPEAIV